MKDIRPSFNIFKEKGHILKMLNLLRTWIRLLSTVLVLIFGWLKFSGVPIVPLTTSYAAAFLLVSAMVLYYFSWVFGALWDAQDQALVYISVPNSGRIPLVGIILMISLAIVFGVLCWVQTYRTFAMFLSFFWLINLSGWYYWARRISKEASERSYDILNKSHNWCEVAKLDALKYFIDGKWQWWRFGIGGLLIVFIFLLSITSAPSYIRIATNALSDEFIMVCSILIFILVVESWIWIERVKRRVSFDLIDRLCATYSFEPKQ